MRHLFLLALLVAGLGLSACGQGAKLNEDLALKYLVQMPRQATTHPAMLVLLHGYGSNEADLMDLVKMLPENMIIVSARGPMTVTLNGYQWYEMMHSDGHHAGKTEDMERSCDLVLKLIDGLVKKYKVDAGRVYLGGFSQGAMMSYYIGLTHPDKLRGIAPLSGMVVESVKHSVQKGAALNKLKIFAGHGDVDDRIPYADDVSSVKYLEGLGLHPEFHTYKGMAHQISRDEIADLAKWLK